MSRGMTKTIEVALAKRYAAPEYAFLLQVRNGTGFQRTTRTADALAFSLYPSRGLTIAGFEIKASKSDWKRELTNPEKAEDIARHCHTWFVVAPKGVVPTDEVPHNWGLMELHDSGKLITTKGALPQEPEPLTPLMLASVMRNISTGMIPISSIQSQIDDAVQQVRKDADIGRDFEVKKLRQRIALVEEFEAASGVRIGNWEAGRIGEAVRMLLNLKSDPGDYLKQLGQIRDGVRHLDSQMTIALDEIEKAVAS